MSSVPDALYLERGGVRMWSHQNLGLGNELWVTWHRALTFPLNLHGEKNLPTVLIQKSWITDLSSRFLKSQLNTMKTSFASQGEKALYCPFPAHGGVSGTEVGSWREPERQPRMKSRHRLTQRMAVMASCIEAHLYDHKGWSEGPSSAWCFHYRQVFYALSFV